MQIKVASCNTLIVLLLILSSLYCVRAFSAPLKTLSLFDGKHRSTDWISVEGSHRVRYQALNSQFRSGRSGSDQALSLRTTILTKFNLEDFNLVVEGIDSRVYLDDRGTPLNSTMVNAFDLLQAYAEIKTKRWVPRGESSLKLGRFTIDAGSRRLVARNKFRNTINSFTGLEWNWKLNKNEKLQIFFTLPVQRMPTSANRLDSNSLFVDREYPEIKFWGLYYYLDYLPLSLAGEVYIVGLHENDGDDIETRNSGLYTPGFRIYRKRPGKGFDYLLEVAFQFGEKRQTSNPIDERDLDHFAHFEHFELGYNFENSFSTRISFEFDYASGDRKSNNGESGRFETLFGARRFDFGPTGIFGPFARANTLSPGVRMNMKFTEELTLMAAFRSYWLASKHDSWVKANLRDPEGESGPFLGHQLEARLRYNPLFAKYRFEFGVACLDEGRYRQNFTNSKNTNSLYGYGQISFNF